MNVMMNQQQHLSSADANAMQAILLGAQQQQQIQPVVIVQQSTTTASTHSHHNNNNNNESLQRQCRMCGKCLRVSNRNASYKMANHVCSAHLTRPMFSCLICGRESSNFFKNHKGGIAGHLNSVHKREAATNGQFVKDNRIEHVDELKKMVKTCFDYDYHPKVPTSSGNN